MDLLSVIALVSGLAGAALGGLGWWKANSASAAAAACHRVAEEALQAAVEAPHTAQDANPAADVRNPPAPQVSPARDGPQGAVDNAQTANLVVRSGSSLGQDLPTNQGTGSGLIGVFLVNQGPAVAHELRLFATFPNGTIRNSETYRSLSANKEITLFAQVLPQDFGSDLTMDILYRVAYRDGNGERALQRKVRLDGGWQGPWKTFIEEDIGVLIDRLNRNPVSASGAEID